MNRKKLELPNGWKRGKLGSICNLQAGKFVAASDISKTKKVSFYPCYGANGLRGYVKKNSHNGIFPLIGRQGALCGNIKKVKGKFFATEHAVVATPKLNTEVNWLYFQLIFADLNKYATGVAQPGLSVKNIKEVFISIPPFSEQKAIANLLSTWDEAIDKIERLIQAKEKILQHTAKCLLFGHKKINNQKVSLLDSTFFKYPCDWKLIKIAMIAKEISQRSEHADLTVLSCSKYDGFVDSLAYFGKQVFSNDTSNYKVIKKGQFGYPSNHIEEGSIGLLSHCEKGIVSPIYVVFDVNKEKVCPEYLFKLLKTNIFQHIFKVTTSASVDRRGSLRWKDFSKIKIPLPPLDEQHQIAETLNIVQKEINLLKQLSEKYKLQKRGLMQKLLTGEWRVRC